MKKIMSLFLVLALLFSTTTCVFADPKEDKVKKGDVTQTALVYWENTYNTNVVYQYELYQADASSKGVQETTSYTVTVRATNSAEAISKVESGAEAGASFSGLSASANYGTQQTNSSTGEVTWEFTVSGSKTISYIQYYDKYQEYKYTYYIYVLRDTYGKIYEYDYQGQLISKVGTGKFELREGRTAAN